MSLIAAPHNKLRAALLSALASLLILVVAVALPLRPAHAQESRGTVILTSGRLNVRGGPSATFAVVGKLPAGGVVSILERSAAGDWLRVAAADLGVEGWVAASFIEVDSAAPALPALPGMGGLAGVARSAATPAATSAVALPTPTPRANESTRVTAPAATLAATTGTSASTATIASPAAGAPAAVAVTSASAAAPVTLDEPTAYVVPAAMNVRGGPGINYARMSGVTQGTALPITGVTAGGDWYRVDLPTGQAGWVAAALVTTAGPVERIATLADADIPATPVAEVEAVAASASAPAVGAAVASAPLPLGGGNFAYGLTANMWQGDKAGVAGLLNDLGATWVKQQVRWEYVETAPGAVNWQEMDAIVNQMNGAAVNVAFSVVTSPAWTRPTKGGTNGPPEDFQTYANFVGAMAGRYCGQSLKAIEVWNEQNLRREWEGFDLNPALYMDLLKRAYASIKAACPSMVVISGATTPAGYSDVAFDDIDYLRGMYENGLARYSDAVGIHPSGFANPPSVRMRDWESGAYTALSHANHRSFYFLSTLEESHAVMAQYGDGAKKLWPTEFGWGSSLSPDPGYEYQARISEQQQADWITEAFRIMGGTGYVGVAFLWNLNYDFGEMRTFSIVGRPAYDALKAQIRQ